MLTKNLIRKLILLTGILATSPIWSLKNLVLIAAPGSGKGTLSQYLVQKYGYVQICPGDLLRAEINAQTPLGQRIKPIVERGDYVDETLVCELITKHLNNALQQHRPFIIDGFPRTATSLTFLEQFFKQNQLTDQVCFVQLIAPDAVCIERITNRQVCNNCFKVYNRQTVLSQDLTHCDQCHAPLALRTADTLEIAIQRLNYFHTQIEPLLAQITAYSKHIINTEQPLAQLHAIYDNLVTEHACLPPA